MGGWRYRHPRGPPQQSCPPGQLTLHEVLNRRGRPSQQASSGVPESPGSYINADRVAKVQKAQQLIRDAASKAVEIQRKALSEALEMLYPYTPRSGQLQALFRLIFNRGDLILIAKTSFGKSMIPQALSVLMD